MPKVGMEPIRREALVNATITEIGLAGTLDVTVAQIARRAGMSSALAHHYFGSKEQIFLAAMRHILKAYAHEVRTALSGVNGPEARLRAIIRANFGESSFRSEALSAWLHFYVLAQTVPEAERLLRVYQRRLRSNLAAELRAIVDTRAPEVADALGAMIDGVYLREALSGRSPNRVHAIAMVERFLDLEIRS